MKSSSSSYILGLRTAQLAVYNSPARHRVLVAGRRFGKTELALTALFTHVVQKPFATAWYVAPSYRQAKQIAWYRLKEMTRPYWTRKPYEGELAVHLYPKATITLKGADNPDSLRGAGLDFVVLDEYASMKPKLFQQAIYPALSGNKGRALLIGTPSGHNHFYEIFKTAQSGRDPNWAGFHFTTKQGGLIPDSELEIAASIMDTESFNQEFNAEFTGSGDSHVYYPFHRSEHVKPLQFEPLHPLIWTLDFNVNPMSMLLIQCVNGGKTIHVLDEISLKHSNTESACNTFLQRVEPKYNLIPAYQRPLDVKVYGDASGNQHRTSGSDTDWAIVRNFFGKWKGHFTHTIHVNTVNPAVRDRVNCVNTQLKSADDEVHLFIDPRCQELIKDLEQVIWKSEPNGQTGSQINKSDPNRTHMSDALGYYVAQAFPLRPLAGPNASGRLFDLS